jgi:(2Fe-2S) ferredoxin
MTAPVQRRCVLVCQHRSCLRSGSVEVLRRFQASAPAQVLVSDSNCLGQCASGPTVQIAPDGIWYCRVQPSDVDAIVEQHLQQNQPVTRLLHPRFHPRTDAVAPPVVHQGDS